VVLLIFGVAAVAELRWNWLQSKVLSIASARLTYGLGEGVSPSFATAPPGPYDTRLGYTHLPGVLERLGSAYRVEQQARSSGSMMWLTGAGGFPVYPEKSQAGLLITDRDREPLFSSRYPQRIYQDFDSIPPLVVRTLLFIENRRILDGDSPYQNPAIEWNRLAKAAGDLALNKVYSGHSISGGSTLATQLEKVRHSEDGRTSSVVEKFRQMTAASLRAYRNGEDTTKTRQDIVRDYLSSFPLGALPGYGEVAGLQEGLLVFYGVDPDEVNRLLRLPPAVSDPDLLARQAAAYRQVLSLVLALNRPSYYLRRHPTELNTRVDAYLILLDRQGIIPSELAGATRAASLQIRERQNDSIPLVPTDKGTLALRGDLLATLGVSDTYALDRMDVAVSSTFDGEAQRAISKELRALANPAYAEGAGLGGFRLLGPANDGSVIFSFILYERGPQGNLLRVESDSYGQPLSINRGTRLELGSTAKLRTLVTYLETVVALHEEYKDTSAEDLRAAYRAAHDRISRWALGYLALVEDRSLETMLEAALDRPYSASTEEEFFTGGGLHKFSNFEAKDNGAVLTVRQAFRRSVNLVFIRLMRDIEEYFAWRLDAASPAMLADPADPNRAAYLARFADIEGRQFLEQFWADHRDRGAGEALDEVARRVNGNLRRLTAIFRSVKPAAPPQALAGFLLRQAKVTINPDWNDDLYHEYDPARFNWNDLGYLSNVHPLELWLLRYRHEHAGAGLSEAIAASADVRQDVYQWLFRKKNIQAQNLRIRTVLEREAFGGILKSWKRQGYPFSDIVASYASALGSSGDNPAALAELAGIILNDGVRKTNMRVNEVHFAEGTPFETLLKRTPAEGERVYPLELAQVVRRAMFDVVENGTGRRAFRSLVLGDTVLGVGGKTGTGDNRIEVRDSAGRLIDSRAINRTAIFVFVIEDRFFGTVTAYVPGNAADQYQFTSALPVQLFRHLAPHLEGLLMRAPEMRSEHRTEPAPAEAPAGGGLVGAL
jgi:membrane peptidoglycan carboxypeptidase